MHNPLLTILGQKGQILINAPADVVFRYVSCFDLHYAWGHDEPRYAGTSDGPVGVGSTLILHNKFPPEAVSKAIRATVEVVEFVPNQRLVWEADVSFLGQHERMSIDLQPRGAATLVKYRDDMLRVNGWFLIIGLVLFIPTLPFRLLNRNYILRGLKSRLDEKQEVLARCTEAVALNPADPLAYLARGDAYVAIGDFERGITGFDKAIELDPNCSSAYLSRGCAYAMLNEQFERAISDFDSAIQLDANAVAYGNRMNAHAAVGRFTQADEDLARALSLTDDPRVERWLTSVRAGWTFCRPKRFLDYPTPSGTRWNEMYGQLYEAYGLGPQK